MLTKRIKMKKKILSGLLALALVFGSAAALPKDVFTDSTSITASAESNLIKSGNYNYKVLTDGTIEIINYVGTDTTLTIPSTLDEKTVTSIGKGAFIPCRDLKEITIPGSVKSIGESAFEAHKSLTSVVILNGVEQIQDKAFQHCANLKSITIPSSIKSIGMCAFTDCTSLESITIPGSVEELGGLAFWNCTKLASVTIEKGVTTIGKGVFTDCTALTDVTIPDSVTNIMMGAFTGCTSLADITLPNSVTSIGSNAFCECTSLADITIPNSVTSIGDHAFYNCTSLTSATIPKSVTSIGWNAFYGCKIFCYKGTAAEEYAKKKQNHTECVLLDVEHVEAAAATCTKDGNIEYWVYKDKYYSDEDLTTEITKAQTVTKAEHTLEEVPAKAAACTAEGNKKYYTCTVCNKKFRDNAGMLEYTDDSWVIPKTAHTWSAWTSTAYDPVSGKVTKTHTCKVCNITENSTVNLSFTRLSGKNRYASAANISKAGFPDGSDTVVLAYGLNYADALAGVPLAKAMNAPILLTTLKTLPAETLAEIERLNAKKVIILGGTSAVSADVEKALTDKKLEVERIAGKTRFETAAKIADKMQQQNENKAPTDVFFVYYNGFADALSVSAAAAVKGAPIVYLTTNGALNADTAAYLADLKKAGSVKNAYVIGGTSVISDDMATKAAKALGLAKATRVAGANRFETCVAVNEKFADVLGGDMLCVATGMDFPDALAGGVYAANNNAPLFLINGKLKTSNLNDKQKAYLIEKKPSSITAFGGTSVVPDGHIEGIAKNSI